MTTDLSLISLIAQASLTVQFVMLLLLLASVASWALIFRKRKVVAVARELADGFERRFWSGGDLSEIYKEISERGEPRAGMESIFEAGFTEFARLRREGVERGQVVEGSRRAMRISQMKEMDRLEESLSFLATVGSTSPYVGLFGTVWGIMNAFRALGTVQQATLSMVAPGIAEALIATAMGLFAAIPAVIAYNRFADDVDRLENRYDTFMEEFSAILDRHAEARS